jgi:hypothetical protein
MAPKLAPKKEEVGAGRPSRKAPLVKEEVGARQASKKAPAPRPRVKPDVEREVDEVQREVVQDEALVKEPLKRRRLEKDAATKVPSEALDLESGAVQRCKKPRRLEAPAAAVAEAGLPSLAGLLPSAAGCHDADLPLEIPKEYFEGSLHLPESVVAVKLEKPDEETIVVDMLAIPWSDSSAVCRQVLDALVKEPRSDLHSMSPVMKSYLIHVLESMGPKEPAKKAGSQKKAGYWDDMIASLRGLSHDTAALQRMRHGWSGPWGPGRHHIAVNLMDQALEMQDKKRPRGHRAPAVESSMRSL